ncbi:MAG: lysogenization regulator HflD [Gammaproteobacteria bacterium RBG_16_57_12]|nr:MAG: lysogenization regulator HflD [Gammaproteobacteria bacterium RBG_16_57_12]
MSHTSRDRTIAFAGVFQAADLVNQIAVEGKVEPIAFNTSINSLFQTNPATTDEVFGGVAGIERGLQCLIKQLGANHQGRDINITRYVISLLHLERKLSRQHQMLDKIATGIEKAQAQSVHFSTTHSNVIANLAGLYQETVSSLTPRIVVSGAQGHLTVTENAEQVRALLLAGIRAAILWRQCGGKRWKLLFSRNEMRAEVNRLLGEIRNK